MLRSKDQAAKEMLLLCFTYLAQLCWILNINESIELKEEQEG